MKNYLEAGGNIFLMTSAGRNFLGNDLVDYVGIEWSSSTLAKLQDFRSVNSQLTNISLIADQVFINTFKTNLTSTSAELLYQAEEGFDTPKGVGVISRPEGKGDFVLFTCKPYLLNNTDLASNVEYILQNFLHEPITSINDNKELIKEFIVNSLYPNPFNPTTTLEFYLPFSNQVSIEVYNIIGERLDVIFNSKLNSGWHNYKWQPSNLSSGVYFIRISAGEFNTTKKTILLK